ncbi:MAG TPA: carbohydrate binding family 9 domain-containing protein, partial [Terriglobales bacterium]
MAVFLLSALIPPVALAVEQAPLRIPRVSRPPKLSDFVNGTPREAEVAVNTFWQFDPHDGEPISQPTTAYLSYDDKNLYVGWICKDDPKRIYARVAPRKQIKLDDRVTINIDTFSDHKHAYWFDVNPYGIQFDGRTTDGIGDDSSWEGLWYSEGKVTEDGYVVLEAIPFKTLRFPRASKQVWYICLARAIQRNNEFSVWPFVSHAKMPQFVGQFAPIEIDEDISPGRNFQMIPYGIYSHESFLDPVLGPQLNNERQIGLDAKAVIHDALTLDLAANPDFSEIGTD